MNSDSTTVISNPWSLSAEEILERSNVTREKGFDKKQTKRLIQQYGPNRLREAKKQNLWQLLLNQVRSLIVILLAATAVLSFAFQEWMDGFAIAGVIAWGVNITSL